MSRLLATQEQRRGRNSLDRGQEGFRDVARSKCMHADTKTTGVVSAATDLTGGWEVKKREKTTSFESKLFINESLRFIKSTHLGGSQKAFGDIEDNVTL